MALLILTNYYLAGWLGIIAGGVTSYYYLNFGGGITSVEGIYSGRLLSEPIAAFRVVLFAFMYTLYQKKEDAICLNLAAIISLVALIYTRTYFLILSSQFLYLSFYYRRNFKVLTIIIHWIRILDIS